MTYTVRYDRDDSGWWIASVPKVRGCHTQGRTVDEARRRIREALSLFVGHADTATLKDDVRLPARARAVINRYRTMQRRLEQDKVRASKLSREAARTLQKELRLSRRDTGELLGLSHQRIQQLVQSGS